MQLHLLGVAYRPLLLPRMLPMHDNALRPAGVVKVPQPLEQEYARHEARRVASVLSHDWNV